MVVKVYISGISGNKEVKKRQQRVMMILDSKNIKYDIIDIAEPGREADKDFMQNNSTSNGGTVSDPNPRSPLPPQIFNDEEYCGDYDQFDMANEVDTLEVFLKVELPPEEPPAAEQKVVNGDAEKTENGDSKASKENSQERDTKSAEKEGTPAPKEGTPAPKSKEGTPAPKSKEGTPAPKSKEGTPTPKSKEGTPAPKSKEGTPAPKSKEGTPASKSKEGTPAPESKEGTPAPKSKEGTPAPKSKEGTPAPKSKEGTPAADASREASQERQSFEKEAPVEETKASDVESAVKSAKSSKESTPQRENGSVGSREQSQDKDEPVVKKTNPSEALIESEQAAAAE
ncbi:SH3 domain-binding glutamic acid-rich protein-like [Cydia fagiglandana]|uniref:SH3 domain-binding glutamic acid-rich protein-like n=1 Tax=Cydia fagiglandana TaxID=1458189 RepID=UPI002FEE3905